MFSPYYAWRGRRDPLDHCALNVALYGPRSRRWAMTERGRSSVQAGRTRLRIGPSSLRWTGSSLEIVIDERTAPYPRSIQGLIRVHPLVLASTVFRLDDSGRHRWHPVAPRAHVEVELDSPALRWSGSGYLDSNFGDEPLEDGFSHWEWSRADCGDRTAVLYHTQPRAGAPLALAQASNGEGIWEPIAPGSRAELGRTLWRIPRSTWSERGEARVVRTLEDGPFYARSLVESRIGGNARLAVHESLSLERFSSSWVKLLLPFRMPRWT